MGYYLPFLAVIPLLGVSSYALLTRPPLSLHFVNKMLESFDLHVLSMPLAFILSQDQTLHKN